MFLPTQVSECDELRRALDELRCSHAELEAQCARESDSIEEVGERHMHASEQAAAQATPDKRALSRFERMAAMMAESRASSPRPRICITLTSYSTELFQPCPRAHEGKTPVWDNINILNVADIDIGRQALSSPPSSSGQVFTISRDFSVEVSHFIFPASLSLNMP